MSQRIRPGGSATSPHTQFLGPTPAVSCRLSNRSRLRDRSGGDVSVRAPGPEPGRDPGPERLAGAGGVAVRVTHAAPRRMLGPWIGPLTRAR